MGSQYFFRQSDPPPKRTQGTSTNPPLIQVQSSTATHQDIVSKLCTVGRLTKKIKNMYIQPKMCPTYRATCLTFSNHFTCNFHATIAFFLYLFEFDSLARPNDLFKDYPIWRRSGSSQRVVTSHCCWQEGIHKFVNKRTEREIYFTLRLGS